jgi:uncharacterized protein YxjI
MSAPPNITQLLVSWSQGDPAALEALTPLVHHELHRLATRFMAGERELAKVSKKWSGLGKELFTSADNYMLSVDASVKPDDTVRIPIMAAVMCIDMVLKE